jgi:hypothetical protein
MARLGGALHLLPLPLIFIRWVSTCFIFSAIMMRRRPTMDLARTMFTAPTKRPARIQTVKNHQV